MQDIFSSICLLAIVITIHQNLVFWSVPQPFISRTMQPVIGVINVLGRALPAFLRLNALVVLLLSYTIRLTIPVCRPALVHTLALTRFVLLALLPVKRA